MVNTPNISMIDRAPSPIPGEPIQRVLEALGDGVRRSGEGFLSRCPAHDDRHASLSINEGSDGRALLKCHAGCVTEAVVSALGMSFSDLFPTVRPGFSRGGRANAQSPVGVTIAQYAAAKKLPEEFLVRLGLSDDTYSGGPAIRIPYRTAEGQVVATRYRIGLKKSGSGNGCFRWEKGTRPLPYGLDRLSDARRSGYIVVVEGESDAQTLWFHGIPALGLPGAATWRRQWAVHFGSLPIIYVFREPDRGGEAMRDWVGRCPEVRERVRFITIPGVKDPSELHCQDSDDFRAIWERAVRAAIPWAEDNRTLGEPVLPTIRDPIRPTDSGNGERFAEQHQGKARFCVERNAWFVWDDVRWRINDTEARRLAKRTNRSMYAEAAAISNKEDRVRLAEHAKRSESTRALNAMLVEAASELAITTPIADFDSERTHFLLNCENGLVDLRTGELASHNREVLITKLAPVRYDPDATHPLWESFLRRMLPLVEVRDFLQRAVGYTLTGSTGDECLFFLHGPTAAGKSTFLEAIKATLGDYAATTDFETFLRRRGDAGTRNDIARLAGIRLCASLEVDEGRELAEGLLKNLTGGDTVSSRFLYKEFFEFQPIFKLWLVANHKPHASSEDAALWRRILLVPFTESLPEAERDPHIKAVLTRDAHARAAILAWAVRGCLAWHREGLNPPPAVRAATEQYRAECDHVETFIADCVEIEPGRSESSVTAKTVRTRYEAWCKASGEQPVSTRKLAAALEQHGLRSDRGSGGVRRWKGPGFTLISE